MSTKHHLSSAQELYVGAGYDALLFGTNGRKGVPVHLLTRVSLGSPIALDADGLIVGATSTELPNNGTKTYTTANHGASPIDNVATPTPSTRASKPIESARSPRSVCSSPGETFHASVPGR